MDCRVAGHRMLKHPVIDEHPCGMGCGIVCSNMFWDGAGLPG